MCLHNPGGASGFAAPKQMRERWNVWRDPHLGQLIFQVLLRDPRLQREHSGLQ